MIIRKGCGPVSVLNPRELPAAIERPPASTSDSGLRPSDFALRNSAASGGSALDPATIDRIARQLDARCRDVEL